MDTSKVLLWELRSAHGVPATCTAQRQISGTVRLDMCIADVLLRTDLQPGMEEAVARAAALRRDLTDKGWVVVYVRADSAA